MEWYFWAFGAVVVFTVLQQLSRILCSLRNTEAMTRRLLAHQGIEWEVASEPSDLFKKLAGTPGAEIAAIKAYREQTGLGLKEAKAVVDRFRGVHVLTDKEIAG